MAKIHTRSFRVRWSELDASGKFAPENYLRYLIETAYDWGESLGFGANAYEQMGIYWLIRETELTIFGYPAKDDVVDFTIWMVNWQKVRGTRSFEITDTSTGKLLAQGNQKIVTMDRNTNRPTNLSEEFISLFKIDDPKKIAESKFVFAPKTESIFTCYKVAEWQDLDAQQHVNNAVYLSYAREAFAKFLFIQPKAAPETLPNFLKMQYSTPAVWGEQLVLDLYQEQPADEDSRVVYLVKIKRESDGISIADCIIGFEEEE